MDPRVNQIRIKTGILKRVSKEKFVNEKEVEIERKRLEDMKTKLDEFGDLEIRRQEEVINECLMMIPDTHKRILNAFNDLNAMLQETESELSETPEFQTAKVLVQEVQQIIQ